MFVFMSVCLCIRYTATQTDLLQKVLVMFILPCNCCFFEFFYHHIRIRGASIMGFTNIRMSVQFTTAQRNLVLNMDNTILT